ncbi:amino acid ABC transporter ATP-binding/permease protein [Actinokineospora sp. 24-640]
MKPLVLAAAAAAAAATAAELAGVGLMATAGWLLLRAAEHPPLGALAVAIVLVRTLALGRGVLRYAERLAGHRAVLDYLAELRGRLYDALAAGTSALSHGDALSRLMSDVDAVQDAVLRCALPWITALLVGATATGAVLLVDPRAGLVVAGGLAVVAVLAHLTTRRRDPGPTLRARLAEQATDLIGGAHDLAVFGATAEFRDRAAATSARIAAVDRSPDGGTAVPVIGAATALTAGLLTSHQGLPTMAAVVLGLLAVFEVATPTVTAARRWPQARAALARLRELTTAEPDSPATTGDRVTLRSATVAYPGRPNALSDVDFDLPPGRKVGVVGPSGSGKSTLLALIAGTRAPTAGTAIAAHPDRVRGTFATDHVFTATLRDNVLLGTGATPVDLLGLPWSTEVDDTSLSGGQRARLLLARALTARPDVLLLDEPAEGLDPTAADALLADVLTYPGAVVIATHRLAALPAADEIVVLEAGRVTQQGPHSTLVAQPGYYRDRWLAERALDELQSPAGNPT